MTAQPKAVCPACGAATPSALFQAHDDRYGYPDPVRVAGCTSCGHKFVDPPLPDDILGELYTRYYQRESLDPAGFRPYRPAGRLRVWLNGDLSSAAMWVPPGVRVLDIGCGMGANVAYHAARGCDAHGVDADANVRAVAARHGLNIRIGLFDPAAYEPGYFDYVTMDQVFEHVSDPLATLSAVRAVLRAEGRLVISTPNANGWGAALFGKRWINWHAPYHQQFVSPRSMQVLARRAGFVVERISTITRSAWLAYQVAHLLAYPSPGEPSAFWAPGKARPGTGRRLLIKLVMASRLTLLPQLATRLFDALGRGDNHVIILRRADPMAPPG
jgi:2-polyprenyl-3-methyl-5-hydroxy-6-metoxy-1,4-benzoquinol methylase